jgi:large subunit ribosomal protein L25
MKTSFELGAEFRETQGKGASRRLRHEGKVPAILYGGHSDARALTLSHQKLLIMLDNERFYSTILSLKVGDQTQAAILKDVQRHPFKNAIVHIDFSASKRTRRSASAFRCTSSGAAVSPGVKIAGRHRVAHAQRSGSQLPAEGSAGIHRSGYFGVVAQREHPLSQLKIPEGVELLVDLAKEDAAVVAIHSPRAEEPEPTAAAAAQRSRRRRRLRQRHRRRRRRGCGKKAALRRRPMPRRNRRRKTPRSKRLRSVVDEGRQVAALTFFWVWVGESTMAGLPLRVIVGLGNPGPEHLVTRHNAGFWFVDLLARRHGGEFRDYRKYSGETARITSAARNSFCSSPRRI